ncbi:MAG: PIN domain-containing protein [Oscillochloridaceae bacterium umkhey_bin13]
MRTLLDTNILIHREAGRVVRKDIGVLFYWLDRLGHEKCVHPLSLDEIRKHKDPAVVASFEIKAQNYHLLRTQAPDSPTIQALRAKFDTNPNDTIDTSLLNEVFSGRVDLLITEDRKVHVKAQHLGIAERVFTIDAFLEKVTAENPSLAEYKVLSVRQAYFGDIDISDPFFDSFKQDYPGFEQWFARKSDEIAYICKADEGQILAFLYVKPEATTENYSDITPSFAPKKRLKIGTFKVISNGYKLGERFLKIIFDNALRYKVEEIYVTIFDRSADQERLIYLLEDWGFSKHGVKRSAAGEEVVLVRDFSRRADLANPCLTYPFFSGKVRKFIVPIYPEYHTELFPDSILRTESPVDFVENRPNRNAISKVYISRSYEKGLKPGDVVVFYRTASGDGPAYYTSVASTIGVVQSVHTNISTFTRFVELCRKRSVFSDKKLQEYWDWQPRNRPFVVNFAYIYSFPKRLNLKSLRELGIIEQAPRGFERLTDQAFTTLLEHSQTDKRLLAD